MLLAFLLFSFFAGMGISRGFCLTNSDTLSGDNVHVLTAGDRGCCSLPWPFALHRQCSLSCMGRRDVRICSCLAIKPLLHSNA